MLWQLRDLVPGQLWNSALLSRQQHMIAGVVTKTLLVPVDSIDPRRRNYDYNASPQAKFPGYSGPTV